MHQVAIVDDERMIREGILRLIEWDKLQLKVAGVFANGLEALQFINSHPLDIVITDIKMPEMDGLELIDSVHAQYQHTKFIVLTGYDEFEFAQKAMRCGVEHYILKPCDEQEITKALVQLTEKLRYQENKNKLFFQLEEKWRAVLPQVKERFLLEVIEYNPYHYHDYERFREWFQIPPSKFRLLIIKPLNCHSFLEQFALKNIAEEWLSILGVYISTIYKGDVLLLIGSSELEEISSLINQISAVFWKHYGKNASIAISDENTFHRLYQMYMEAKEYMEYAFYLGEGNVVTHQGVRFHVQDSEASWRQNYEEIALSIKNGHVEDAINQIRQFFQRLEKIKPRIDVAKVYCLELLISIVRHCQSSELSSVISMINNIRELQTLQQIEQVILDYAAQIATSNLSNDEYHSKKYSPIVERAIACIHKELFNPDLSLKWIAKEVLFMNEDYLGRLFHRETGERFSQYLTRVRMEKAKYLIEKNTDLKLYEIADLTGFKNKYHYFSLTFKKYTGHSPSEYKRLISEQIVGVG